MKTLPILLALAATLHAAPPEPKFRAVTIDDKIQIGYGVAVADVDGDGRPDILLADKKQFVWYQNPGQPPPGAESFAPSVWSKFILAENLTEHDNVCLAAQDIDGDGKCEIAVGAEWNPGDTVNSGAVFYMIPPADRTQKWEPVKFPNVEPTTHRMKWIKLEDGTWNLMVVPLHGRGSKNGKGAGVRILLYHPPAPLNDPHGEWSSEQVSNSLRATHNFDSFWVGKEPSDWRLIVANSDGVYFISRGEGSRWEGATVLTDGSGEVRCGHFRPGDSSLLIATIEPMHGNQLAVAMSSRSNFERRVLTDKLTEGHALACGDVLGVKSDQVVVGWRGTPGKEGSTIGDRPVPITDNGRPIAALFA